jgi:DNA-binding NtrC family response regulator
VKASIFYLDDEEVLLNLFNEVFGEEYEVRTTSILEEARKMLEERASDIIISDQKMPEIKGTDFLREIARLYPKSYRILLTGNIGLIEVAGEIGEGIIQTYLPKPWTEGQMREVFERAIVEIDRNRKT